MMIPLIVVIVLNILSGAANTLIASGMNKIAAPPGSGLPHETFAHPFVQTLVMMIGEGSCLIAFALMYWRSKPEGASPWHRRQLLFAIPCCFDWCATSMMYASMLDLPGSQVQMLRGSLVIFVFLISLVGLRNKQYAHHYLGVLLVVVGITCVGFSAMLSNDDHADPCAGDGTPQSNCPAGFHCVDQGSGENCAKGANGICIPSGDTHVKNPMRGVIVCLSAQILCALLMTSEEKIFRKLHTPAILAIGVEGTCGVLIGIVVLTATYLLGVEQPGEAGYQIFHSGSLFATSALLCVSIALFNCSGVKITKSTSATSRSTIDGLRTLLVWAGDMSLGWAPRAYWTLAFWLQPIGFCITMLGTLIYFNTIAIPSLMGEDELVEYYQTRSRARELEPGTEAFLPTENEMEDIDQSA
eukprot:GEMP01021929.1.p1 GENE.GEMP01021929.1~~GEMP01021929.1.p1  ORF type:complete len:413 (-),score=78.06 GEMP01021929.1:1194-2432(-)